MVESTEHRPSFEAPGALNGPSFLSSHSAAARGLQMLSSDLRSAATLLAGANEVIE
jgi:hypothetical protein